MSMNEYELSLAAEAIKGKRKALNLLIDSYHDHLVDVVEKEMHSRDKAEMIIKSVKKRARIETMILHSPADFEQMIDRLTIAECMNYTRGNDHNSRPVAADYSGQKNDRSQMPINRRDREAYRPADGSKRPVPPQPAMQYGTPDPAPFRPAAKNNTPAAAPLRPAMQGKAPDAPFRPAAQNNPSAAAPLRPAMQGKASDAPFRPAAQNNAPATPASHDMRNREQHVQNRFVEGGNASSVNPLHRVPESYHNRSTSAPIELRSVNMGNAVPRENTFRTSVHNASQQLNDQKQRDFSHPMQQRSWSVPKNQVEDDEKTELLIEEPKIPLRTAPQDPLEDDAKTEILIEEPRISPQTAPQSQSEDVVKTELLTEEPKMPLQSENQDQYGEAKTVLLVEEPQKEQLAEAKTARIPVPESESASEPKTEPIPEPKTMPEGELLFKPDQVPLTPDKASPNPPVIDSTIPKVGLLVCTKGENVGENFSLIAGRNRVGVSEDCDIRIKDASLTEDYNFEIIYDDRRENFTLVPGKLSSRLFVNNNYVDSAVFLQAHDTLRTGNSVFLLVSFQ